MARFAPAPHHPKAPCVYDRAEDRVALVETAAGAQEIADALNLSGSFPEDYIWRPAQEPGGAS